MGNEPGDEALPRMSAAQVSVQPEAPVPGAQDLSRTDRVRLGRDPRPVPTEGMQSVLHNGHRVQLDEPAAARAGRRPCLRKLRTEVRLPERDVASPADAAVADIGTAEVGDPVAVAVDDVTSRGKWIWLSGGRRSVSMRPKKGSHMARWNEPAQPIGAVLPSWSAYSSMLNVWTWCGRSAASLIETRGDRELRHRPDRQDRDELPGLVSAAAAMRVTRSSANAS